jgi:hypothetical protein
MSEREGVKLDAAAIRRWFVGKPGSRRVDALLDALASERARADATLTANRQANDAAMDDMGAAMLRAEARADAAEKLVREIDRTLRVPAAEYVPAIQDVFTMIDRAALARGEKEKR